MVLFIVSCWSGRHRLQHHVHPGTVFWVVVPKSSVNRYSPPFFRLSLWAVRFRLTALPSKAAQLMVLAMVLLSMKAVPSARMPTI